MKSAEEISIIQKKSKEERTEEEIKKLESFEMLRDNEIDDKSRLEYLLNLVSDKEDREIYIDRYEINSKLLKQNPLLEEEIDKNIANEKINLQKDDIGRTVFTGENTIDGIDYKNSKEKINRRCAKK